MNKKILGGVSAVAVGVVGTGVYLAVPASAGPSPSTTATAKAKAHGRHPGQRVRRVRAVRGVHGQATVRTKKGFAQVDWQRGTLTAASGGTLTIRSADGVTWQWKTDGTTKVRRQGAKSAVSNLATGDFVVVLGRDASGARTARRVVVPRKVPAKATTSPAPSHG